MVEAKKTKTNKASAKVSVKKVNDTKVVEEYEVKEVEVLEPAKPLDLLDFLEQDNVVGKTYTVILSERLKDFPFTIKPMTFEEYTKYQQNASKIRRKGVDFDNQGFFMDIITGHTIDPDFKDSEILKRFNCYSAEEFINKKLYANEINNLGEAILDVSGMRKEFDLIIAQAKN